MSGLASLISERLAAEKNMKAFLERLGLLGSRTFLAFLSFLIAVEVEGEGCYCLCYDDVNGRRIIHDPDIEIRWDYEGSESFVEEE